MNRTPVLRAIQSIDDCPAIAKTHLANLLGYDSENDPRLKEELLALPPELSDPCEKCLGSGIKLVVRPHLPQNLCICECDKCTPYRSEEKAARNSGVSYVPVYCAGSWNFVVSLIQPVVVSDYVQLAAREFGLEGYEPATA